MRPLTHSAHKRFVETEGWERLGTARKRSGTGDHHRYKLPLANGEILYTRVSHGSGQLDDAQLIARIYRDQLQVTEEQFWACVEHGTLPPRPQPPTPVVSGSVLDGKLVRNLLTKVGIEQSELATMSKEAAVARWNEWLQSRGVS